MSRSRSATTAGGSASSARARPADQRLRAGSPEISANGPKSAGPRFTIEGSDAPSEAASPTGLRANEPHSTSARTRESSAAQRAATRPEKDSATSTGRQSIGRWPIACSR